MRLALILVAAFAIIVSIGCSTMVSRPSTSKYAPVNGRRGVVRYAADGADFVVQARRNDAYEEMYKACEGPYRILREGGQYSGTVAMVTTIGVIAADTSDWYIEFECLPEGSVNRGQSVADQEWLRTGMAPVMVRRRFGPPLSISVETCGQEIRDQAPWKCRIEYRETCTLIYSGGQGPDSWTLSGWSCK